jgi:ribosome-binding factor A
LKQHGRSSKEPHFIDPEFIDALEENESARASSSRRQVERKTRQFCRQVQRALNFALADRRIGDGIEGLFVEEVSPAPDCGRLLVHVLVPGSLAVGDVIAALSRETPRLRSEVAATITRKRAPELCFVPTCADGGDHD